MTYLDELGVFVEKQKKALVKIRLIAFDVDGVLTNGELHYQGDGEVTKVFNVRDGVGLKLLQDFGIEVAIVTAKDSAMVRKRVTELGIKHYFPGTKDKHATLKSLCEQLDLDVDQSAFVGDDVVDCSAMAASGISFCPSNAYPLVKNYADIVLNIGGGQGVARMVADILLIAKGKYEEAYQLASSSIFERNR